MILEAIFNGEIYPAETVVPKSEKFREAGQAIADTMRYFEQTCQPAKATGIVQ